MKKQILISMVALVGLLSASMRCYSAEEQKGAYIYEYKKELALTNVQEKDLKSIVARFQSLAENKQKDLNEASAALKKLIAENGDLEKIRKTIHDMAEIQAEMSYEGIASNRAIEKDLNETQLSKWRGIQAAFAQNLQKALDVRRVAGNAGKQE